MFSFQETRGVVEVAFTDRHRGDGPDAALDLAEPLGEPPERSERDRLARNLDVVGRALAAVDAADAPDQTDPADPADPVDAADRPDLAAPVVVRMRQVHGAVVHTVDRDWLDDPASGPPEADGLVTTLPGVALLVRAADCVPLVLADVEHRVVGAAHAGRPGLVAGVVPATIARMRELGADRIVAWLGPHVCGRCYEVPAAMREEVAAVVPEAYAETASGTPAVDIGAGVLAQLGAAEVEVVDASRCTLEHEDLYSYRREGAAAGRLGGLVWVRP